MKSTDNAFVTALKTAAKPSRSPAETDRARNQFASSLEKVGDAEVASSVREIADYLFKRTRRRELGESLDPPYHHIPLLKAFGLKRSAELAFLELLGDADPPPLETAIRCAPTGRAIEAWRQKLGGLSKDSGNLTEPCPDDDKVLLRTALGDPSQAVRSGLGEWSIEKVDASRIVETLPLFKAAERELSRQDRDELFRKALARDRTGAFLLRSLREVATTDAQLLATAAAIRSDDKSLERALAILPSALLGDDVGRLGQLAVHLFEGGFHLKSAERRASWGRMITFFGQLISPEATSEGLQVALRGLEEQFRQMDAASTADSLTLDQPWVVRRAGGAPTGVDIEDSPSLSSSQGTTVCIAIEKLRGQPQALAVVEAMAANLGLGYFGTERETVAFDPLVHEDTVGGMVPGESARLLQSGWKLGDKVILRATVE